MEKIWKWYTFEELTTSVLYAILKLRQEIFIVEQQCAYLDCDGIDERAHHLVGWYDNNSDVKPFAYLRIISPAKEGELPAIGRLLTHPDFRVTGVGRLAMEKALLHLEKLYPGSPVRILAQEYLTQFYESLGFVIASDSYDEDGIPHVAMIRNSNWLAPS